LDCPLSANSDRRTAANQGCLLFIRLRLPAFPLVVRLIDHRQPIGPLPHQETPQSRVLVSRCFTQLAVGTRQEKDAIVTSDLSKRAKVV